MPFVLSFYVSASSTRPGMRDGGGQQTNPGPGDTWLAYVDNSEGRAEIYRYFTTHQGTFQKRGIRA